MQREWNKNDEKNEKEKKTKRSKIESSYKERESLRLYGHHKKKKKKKSAVLFLKNSFFNFLKIHTTFSSLLLFWVSYYFVHFFF